MKFKVVIVDDNRPTADMVHKIIDWESLGCSVVSTSYDSYAGKAAILEHKPDLVIADINMPGMDGRSSFTLLITCSSRLQNTVCWNRSKRRWRN